MNLPKETILNERLTHRALGILVRALMLGDGATVALMTDAFPEGRDSVARGFKLLRSLGYMRRVVRHGDGGHIYTVNEFSPVPVSEWPEKAEGDCHYE